MDITKVRIKLKNLPVDAGNISVCDADYIKSKGGTKFNDRLSRKVSLSAGNYKVKAKIPGAWEGKVESEFNLTVGESGVLIGDSCYYFPCNDKGDTSWSKFLDETSFLSNSNNNAHFMSTGGDGCFNVDLSFTRI